MGIPLNLYWKFNWQIWKTLLRNQNKMSSYPDSCLMSPLHWNILAWHPKKISYFEEWFPTLWPLPPPSTEWEFLFWQKLKGCIIFIKKSQNGKGRGWTFNLSLFWLFQAIKIRVGEYHAQPPPPVWGTNPKNMRFV